MNRIHLAVALGAGFFLTGCPLPEKASSKDAESRPEASAGLSTRGGVKVKTASGLEYTDKQLGTGPSPATGQRVTVHYTGRLKDGTKFDSSLDRGTPFTFVIGVGQVIKGWDEGVGTMKVGGQRQLVIPPNLAYGERGAGNIIPPNSELTFDVELLGIQ